MPRQHVESAPLGPFCLTEGDPVGYLAGMQTVRETDVFAKQADALLSPEDRAELICQIAANPTKGAVMPGTGGVRKMRVVLPGVGKSGGARAIYYYMHEAAPIYALMVYAKSAKETLTAQEKQALAAFAKRLNKAHPKPRKGTTE